MAAVSPAVEYPASCGYGRPGSRNIIRGCSRLVFGRQVQADGGIRGNTRGLPPGDVRAPALGETALRIDVLMLQAPASLYAHEKHGGFAGDGAQFDNGLHVCDERAGVTAFPTTP